MGPNPIWLYSYKKERHRNSHTQREEDEKILYMCRMPCDDRGEEESKASMRQGISSQHQGLRKWRGTDSP